MNIYLISQEMNIDWDTYDSAVVCAESEDDAKTIHPAGGDYVTPEGAGSRDKNYGSWTSLRNVEVKLIGVADSSVERGVVLASFNAG